MDAAKLTKDGFIKEETLIIREGSDFTGILIGKGADMEAIDPHTGEVRQFKSWRFYTLDRKMVVRVLDAWGISERVSNYPEGTTVFIARGGTTTTKSGREVSIFEVYHKLPVSGVSRAAKRA